MRRWIFRLEILLGLTVLTIVAASGYVYLGIPDVAADTEHRAATHWLLETARERSVARRARSIETRLPDLADEVVLHEAIVGFEDMCAGCHAPPGRSRSALARGLNPPAPDLTRAAQHRSAAELFWNVKHGIRMTGMPAWGKTHGDDALWTLVALVRRFPDLSGPEYERLLTSARAAGVEHHHDPEHEHPNDHGAAGHAHPAQEHHDHRHGPHHQAPIDADQRTHEGNHDHEHDE